MEISATAVIDLLMLGAMASVVYTDITRRLISNRACLVLLLGALAQAVLVPASVTPADLPGMVATATGALLLYAFGAWGGGDAKLTLALTGYFAGCQTDFVILTALLGGMVSLATALIGLINPRSPKTVPYGVALTGAAVILRFFL